jgi:hypothetical protein
VSSLSGGRGINLLQELAAVLRRALTQQAPVREALYKGLLQVRNSGHFYVLYRPYPMFQVRGTPGIP